MNWNDIKVNDFISGSKNRFYLVLEKNESEMIYLDIEFYSKNRIISVEKINYPIFIQTKIASNGKKLCGNKLKKQFLILFENIFDCER